MRAEECVCDCACHVDEVWHYRPCCHLCVLCGERIVVGWETPHMKFCPVEKDIRAKERKRKAKKRKKK